MTVSRNHIKSKDIISLVCPNARVLATATWHSSITVNKRQFAVAKKLSHHISSSSETTGSPVQKIPLPMTASPLSYVSEDQNDVTSNLLTLCQYE